MADLVVLQGNNSGSAAAKNTNPINGLCLGWNEGKKVFTPHPVISDLSAKATARPLQNTNQPEVSAEKLSVCGKTIPAETLHDTPCSINCSLAKFDPISSGIGLMGMPSTSMLMSLSRK